MIKINLLETSKGKGKRGGSAAPSMPTIEMGDMGSPKLKILVVVVLAGLLNLGYWYRLDHQGKAIAAKIKRLRRTRFVSVPSENRGGRSSR